MTERYPVDLHIHSHFSDGKYSPEEIVRRAAEFGLRTIALTDHDNTRGVRMAQQLGAKLGVQVIPAIEFTTRWPFCPANPGGGDVDLLGYRLDLDNPEFQAFEQAAFTDIQARVSECCLLLTRQGYPLELADTLVQNPRYAGLTQVSQAFIARRYAASMPEAFSVVLPVWEHVRLSPFHISQAIEQIHWAGGVAVLAHPALYRCNGSLLTADQVAQLVDYGLDGLEIYHHRLNDEARQHFLGLAQRFNLLTTGGSDEHGWLNYLERLGVQPVTPEHLDALLRHTPK